MLYNWFPIFNMQAFMATELASQQIQLDLVGHGLSTFLVSRGNEVSILYLEDIFLPVNFLGQNPFAVPGYAVFIDVNHDVWFGFEVVE